MPNVRFNILRQVPGSAPRVQSYTLDVEPGSTILDCLNRIKWELDGSLAFRKNCRNTICGSCSMRINGRSALACKESVERELDRLQPPVGGMPDDGIPEFAIAPMGNMPVVKDLVTDMSGFWERLEAVDPYVSTEARQVPEREFLQTPEERSRLDRTGNCILCGACYSDCNALEVNPDFVGPHALAKAQRMVADTRDATTEQRLEKYNNDRNGVWGCTRCFYCNSVCPMEVAPLDRISEIKSDILARNDAKSSQPVRHRKLLVGLVEEGGWIDERKFATRLYSFSLAGLRQLVGLGPLGLRMLVRGKLPLDFEPSLGAQSAGAIVAAARRQ